MAHQTRTPPRSPFVGPVMNEFSVERAREIVDEVYRAESRRVLATLIRLLGDCDLAEEALHDAFASAVEQWSRDGVPKNPRAWLVSAALYWPCLSPRLSR